MEQIEGLTLLFLFQGNEGLGLVQDFILLPLRLGLINRTGGQQESKIRQWWRASPQTFQI